MELISGILIGWGVASGFYWWMIRRQEGRVARRLDAMDAAENLGLLTKRTGADRPWDWPRRGDFPDRTEGSDAS